MLGQSVTFTATVGPLIPGPGTPTGTVTFEENGIPLPGDSTVALVDGTSSFSTSLLTPGNDSITAVYSGDDYFAEPVRQRSASGRDWNAFDRHLDRKWRRCFVERSGQLERQLAPP